MSAIPFPSIWSPRPRKLWRPSLRWLMGDVVVKGGVPLIRGGDPLVTGGNCCYKQLFRCDDNSATGLWAKVADIGTSTVLLTSGSYCAYPSGPLDPCPGGTKLTSADWTVVTDCTDPLCGGCLSDACPPVVACGECSPPQFHCTFSGVTICTGCNASPDPTDVCSTQVTGFLNGTYVLTQDLVFDPTGCTHRAASNVTIAPFFDAACTDPNGPAHTLEIWLAGGGVQLLVAAFTSGGWGCFTSSLGAGGTGDCCTGFTFVNQFSACAPPGCFGGDTTGWGGSAVVTPC